jgi:hypothetical protein
MSEATSRIQRLTLADGHSVLVEVQPAELPDPAGPDAGLPTDLPPGAEPTGLADRLEDAQALLRASIGSMADVVRTSLAEHAPDEWSLELNIGFKGTTQPVPVILSGSAEAALKVKAVWKRPTG